MSNNIDDELFIIAIDQTEKLILNSLEFERSANFGKVRRGHDEGKVGIHVRQIINYIEDNYKFDSDYTSLRLIALLHDIGKYEGNNEYHSITSEKIARKFIQDEEILRLILIHDRPYGYWKNFKKEGKIDTKSFIDLFSSVNWKLLIKFRYSDDCNRSQEASKWFEKICNELIND
ncbi:MAG: HD domain-containing protein [Promethearchaeota archaeon]